MTSRQKHEPLTLGFMQVGQDIVTSAICCAISFGSGSTDKSQQKNITSASVFHWASAPDWTDHRISAQQKAQPLAVRLCRPTNIGQSNYDRMLNRTFTPFPILQTERLTLRQLVITDEQEIFALRSDSEINKYLDRQASETIEDARDFINKVTENIKKSNSLYWVITLTNSKTFVGTICLFDLSDENNKCEIGYELLINFQGQGIMKEAAEKVIEYAIQTMKVQIIEAFTHKDNQNSTKLLGKLKFKKSTKPDNTNPDYFIFSLTNSN